MIVQETLPNGLIKTYSENMEDIEKPAEIEQNSEIGIIYENKNN